MVGFGGNEEGRKDGWMGGWVDGWIDRMKRRKERESKRPEERGGGLAGVFRISGEEWSLLSGSKV